MGTGKTKRPWKVFTAYRTQSFATQKSAEECAKRCHGLISGPDVPDYYFDEVTGKKKYPQTKWWDGNEATL